MLTAVLGAQWGDEGKGKLVDMMSKDFDIVVRGSGGANAGHSVYIKKGDKTEKFIFHLIPSGILYDHVSCVIGNGVVLDLPALLDELNELRENNYKTEGRVKISDRASILFGYHKLIDGLQEDDKGNGKVGTTKKGIGPCYSDKVNRLGLRVADLSDWESFTRKYNKNLEKHKRNYNFDYDGESELKKIKSDLDTVLPMITDTSLYLNRALDEGKKVLLEGANATLLDIDHGTYPFVTSSSPSIGGVFTGTGIPPKHLEKSIGVVKVYITRVGAGPFPTELKNDLGDKICKAGGEFGSTTGRSRRCGWFDVPITKYSIRLNGFDSINLTKLDVLDEMEEIKIATKYKLDGKFIGNPPARAEDLDKVEVEYETLKGWNCSLNSVTSWSELPENAKRYVLRLEELLGCPINYVGVGMRRDQMIKRDN